MSSGSFVSARLAVGGEGGHDQIPQLGSQDLQGLQGSGVDGLGGLGGIGGHPIAFGQQNPFAGMIPRFVEWYQGGKKFDLVTLNQLVNEANNGALDDEAYAAKLSGLKDWLQKNMGEKSLTDDDLHRRYCIHPRNVPGQQQNPTGTNAPTDGVPDPNKPTIDGVDATGSSDDLISPIVAPRRKAGVQLDALPGPGLSQSISPISAERVDLLRNRGNRTATSPVRPEAVRNRGSDPLPTINHNYDPNGCDVTNNFGQRLANPDLNANNAQPNAEKSGAPNSPSNDEQSPNFNPGGGGGYQSKNQPPKSPQIAQASAYPQMGGQNPPDGSCPYCQSIAGMKSQPYKSGTANDIANDLNAGALKAKGIIDDSRGKFLTMPVQQGKPQQPRTFDLLKSFVNKGGGGNNNQPFGNLKPLPNT